ncbi:porin [Thalassospira sp. MCCC 1A01428]|uniref:porin n=1 Tax=unclassified Thalassospira TaxID=2648997 RepID=UPI000A1DA52F|nr:porin [Thalassospira sp. MCCC 1A01428]OSQ45803.1 porin [Thalassospira sp. MCCC 1A01428]
MKKILIATSALVAVAAAGQAQASEPIKLSVGGYMEQWAGIASQDDGHDNINAFQSDTEVYFSGSTTLDNGIEVGAMIQLEGETSGDQIDEQYLYVNGSFGQFRMGEGDGAAGAMGITAPAVGPVGVNDGDLSNWVDIAAMPDTVWDDGDDPKITYYTPFMGGFRIGVSYTDSDTSKNDGSATSSQNTTGGLPVTSLGLEYRGDFDGVSLGLAAVGEHKGEGEWFSVGTTVGFGNFTVGGSYGQKSDDYGVKGGATKLADDTTGFDIGVAYAMDAAQISLSYANGDIVTNDAGAASTGNEIDTVDLGLRYQLGAGVSWRSSIFWFNNDDKAAGGAGDNDGFGAVTGLRLDF